MTRTTHLTTEILQQWLDGALSAGEAESARAHLAACQACRRRMEATASFFTTVETWDDQPPSRDLSIAVVRALRPARWSAPWKLAWGLQLGATLLAVIVGWPLIVELTAPVLTAAVPAPATDVVSAWLADSAAMVASIEDPLRAVQAQVEGWLALAASQPYLWPLALAAAVAGIVGNSVLLRREAGFRSFRSGRP